MPAHPWAGGSWSCVAAVAYPRRSRRPSRPFPLTSRRAHHPALQAGRRHPPTTAVPTTSTHAGGALLSRAPTNPAPRPAAPRIGVAPTAPALTPAAQHFGAAPTASTQASGTPLSRAPTTHHSDRWRHTLALHPRPNKQAGGTAHAPPPYPPPALKPAVHRSRAHPRPQRSGRRRNTLALHPRPQRSRWRCHTLAQHPRPHRSHRRRHPRTHPRPGVRPGAPRSRAAPAPGRSSAWAESTRPR